MIFISQNIVLKIRKILSIEMNTTQKGNELEARDYDILKPILGSGQYGAYSKLYHHKKYYSHDTETYKNIYVYLQCLAVFTEISLPEIQ